MKTRYILLGLCALAWSLPAAQAWKMLPPEGSVQSITNMKVYHGGDTVINGQHYQQVRWTVGPEFHPDTAKFMVALREDTLEQKVYVYSEWFGSQGNEWKEFLLYDFGVEVGDSVNLLLGSWGRGPGKIDYRYDNENSVAIVVAIDTMMLDGVARKRIYLNQESQCFSPMPEEEWYYAEGLGNGVVGYVYGRTECIVCPPLPYLICMHNSDNIAIFGEGDCYLPIGVKVSMQVAEIPFHPNPTSGLVYLNPSMRISHYEVIDMSGRSYGKQVCTGTQIDLQRLPRAYYILRLWEQGQFKSYKIFVDPNL